MLQEVVVNYLIEVGIGVESAIIPNINRPRIFNDTQLVVYKKMYNVISSKWNV